MTYDARLRIIYSDRDNEPSPFMENKLWVDNFIRFLNMMLEQISGSEINLQRITAVEEITHQSDTIYILIASANFFAGEQRASMVEKLMSDDLLANHTFVVFKDSVDDEKIKDILSGSGNNHYYLTDNNFTGQFWLKMADLTYAIHTLAGPKEAAVVNDSSKSGIFLAESGGGLSSERSNLKRDLEHWGFLVLPDGPRTVDELELSNRIHDFLGQSEYSIHLINEMVSGAGKPGKSIEELQIDIAVQHAQSRNAMVTSDDTEFKIFIWSNKFEDLDVWDKKGENIFSRLGQINEVEIVKTSFEEFKNYLKSRITVRPNSETRLQESYVKGTEVRSFFVLFDKPDEQLAKKYIRHLRNRGFSVFSTIFDADLMTVRQIHQESLRRFDVALILAVDTNVNWLNMKLLEIMKAPGLGRKKPILNKTLIVGDRISQQLPPTSIGFDVLTYDENSALETLNRHVNSFIT